MGWRIRQKRENEKTMKFEASSKNAQTPSE
jgi:hypothetical protein